MQCSLRLFQSRRNSSWDLTYSGIRMMRVRLEMELKIMTLGKKNKTIACPGPGRTKKFSDNFLQDSNFLTASPLSKVFDPSGQ